MTRFLLQRLLHGVIVLWVVATLTFVLMRVTPGGPFDRERRLPPEVLANIAAKYHLDEPWLTQYARYLKGIIQGDLGPSYKYLDRSVTDVIADTLPTSVLLGILALALALLLSFPVGVSAAFYQNSWVDRCSMFLATLGISSPDRFMTIARNLRSILGEVSFTDSPHGKSIHYLFNNGKTKLPTGFE